MSLIVELYEQDLGATCSQSWAMLGFLESSWHARHQTLNPERKMSNSKPHKLAAFAYKTYVLLMVLKLRRAPHTENTCIAEMRK